MLGALAFSKFLHSVDTILMRFSEDRLSIPGVVTGLPIVVLTTTGAKSGQARTTPVVGVPDGDNIALVGSNWGQQRNPGWYYNLRAHPVAQIEFGGQAATYTAHEVTDPDEYKRLWQKATDIYIGFAKYQERTGKRKLPIMLMVPQAETA
jgi:deazaflavin-dependent oxidoreductase (nitroreductase family)